MTNFTTRLKELRKEYGLLQKELAHKIGSKRGTVAAWETGRMPERMALTRLADLFNVSTDYLLGRTDTRGIKKDTDGPIHVELDEVIRKANIQFEGATLTEEDKEDIIEIARLLLKTIRKRKLEQ